MVASKDEVKSDHPQFWDITILSISHDLDNHNHRLLTHTEVSTGSMPLLTTTRVL